ncbi:MAG: hypothetical protein AAF371_13690 [Pseudomonadota bacterium]
MHPTHILPLLGAEPGEREFLYLPGAEAPALLAEALDAPAPVAALRRGRYARLLERPILRGLLAAAGDGTLHPADLALLAAPESLPDAPGPAANAALEAALRQPWHRFRTSLGIWGEEDHDLGWGQTSRQGANLVLRLAFPEAHDTAFMAAFRGDRMRRRFEAGHHPTASEGSMTLAWARLDWEPGGEDLLIEELQADWPRFVRWRMAGSRCEKERLRIGHYQRTVLKPYEKLWPPATLLAAILFAARDLGCRRIWLHQPETGVRLKAIYGEGPPRSLYTTLPARFCFEETREAPPFLAKPVRKRLGRLVTERRPLFWRLDLDAPATPSATVPEAEQPRPAAHRHNLFACGSNGPRFH